MYRAPDKDCVLFSRMHISSPNPLFDHLLESSELIIDRSKSNIDIMHRAVLIKLFESEIDFDLRHFLVIL